LTVGYQCSQAAASILDTANAGGAPTLHGDLSALFGNEIRTGLPGRIIQPRGKPQPKKPPRKKGNRPQKQVNQPQPRKPNPGEKQPNPLKPPRG